MKLQKVCKHHNVGYCKYKDTCKFQHPTEDCENKCDKISCMKRHRKLCKYGENCKHLPNCEFKHEKVLDNFYKDIETKLAKLQKTVSELQEQNRKSQDKITSLENELIFVKSKMVDSEVTLVPDDNQHELLSQNNVLGNQNKDRKSTSASSVLCQTKKSKNIEKSCVVENRKTKLIKCKVCGESFKLNNELDEHMMKTHEVSKKVIQNQVQNMDWTWFDTL